MRRRHGVTAGTAGGFLELPLMFTTSFYDRDPNVAVRGWEVGGWGGIRESRGGGNATASYLHDSDR